MDNTSNERTELDGLGARIGYARVAHAGDCEGDDRLEAQIDQLRAAGCEQVFVEIAASHDERPQLTRALDALTAGDTLLVTNWDRIARSSSQVIEVVHALRARGIRVAITGESSTDNEVVVDTLNGHQK